MRKFGLMFCLLLLLACSDDEPDNPFANNPPPDEGVTRTFNIASRCFDCTGSSARQYCIDIAGYQELVDFSCSTDGDGSVCGRPKNYIRSVTCWKAR